MSLGFNGFQPSGFQWSGFQVPYGSFVPPAATTESLSGGYHKGKKQRYGESVGTKYDGLMELIEAERLEKEQAEARAEEAKAKVEAEAAKLSRKRTEPTKEAARISLEHAEREHLAAMNYLAEVDRALASLMIQMENARDYNNRIALLLMA
jgi:hypothetical protein